MKPQAPAILLIERDEITLELYQRELCKSFSVIPFMELGGVLETLDDREIQAVVIEPEICSGEGWKLIDAIHKAFPDRAIPVIVCSTSDAPREGPRREVARHLTKPVLPKTLREITLQVLGLKGT